MRQCGPARTRRTGGWLGVTNDQLAHIDRLTALARMVRSAAFPTSSCWGWEDRASGLKSEDDLRKDQRLPGAARARFHRPRAGEDVREQDRSQEHALHRVQQIGLHARAEHLHAVLLRPRDAARRRPGSRPALRRHHRPARSCSSSPRATAFDTSSSAGRISVDATRCCRISAWSRPPSWAWTWRSSWTGPRRWSPRACRRCRSRDPGVVLGAILGVAARNFGRDKVTIIASPGLEALGAWLEQLLAESTGKDGAGLIIDREASVRPRSTATTVSSSISDCGRHPMRPGTRPSPSWNASVTRSCASASTTRTTSARSSFAGRWRPPWPVPFSASTRSISRTWKPARA